MDIAWGKLIHIPSLVLRQEVRYQRYEVYKQRNFYPYIAEPGVYHCWQCPRLHLCFATVCCQTAGRSISRGRIHKIFGSHAASNRINYLQDDVFTSFRVSCQVCSGVLATTRVLRCNPGRTHGVNEVGGGRGDTDDLPIKALHERGILAFWIADGNIIQRDKNDVGNLAFRREGFAAARRTENQTVWVYRLPA